LGTIKRGGRKDIIQRTSNKDENVNGMVEGVANGVQEEERPVAKLEGQHRYKKDTGTQEIHDAFPCRPIYFAEVGKFTQNRCG
jgi:hypothetical protein